MGGVDKFSAEEALLMIGELYVHKRRAESDLEICREQTIEYAKVNEQLRREIEALTPPKPDGEQERG